MTAAMSNNTDDKHAEYEKLKKKLHKSIIDKKNIDKQLTQLEEEIYAKETLYLTNSYAHHNAGNIIKGIDGFARGGGHSSHSAYGGSRRRTSFTDDDRIFSLSSAIYVKHLQKKNKENGDFDDDEYEDADETPEETTPSANGAGRRRKREE